MEFEQYVEDTWAGVVRVATVLCGDGALGEDIAQSVLLKVFRHWDRVQAADSPDAYVRRMLVNEFLSWRRSKWARIAPVADLDDLLPREPDHAELHAQRVDLLAQVLRLPRRQRAAVVLRYYEGFDDADIADALNCAPSTVRSNIARALASLHTSLAAPQAGAVTVEAGQ